MCLECRSILDGVIKTSYSLYLAMTSTLKITAVSALWQRQICGAQQFSSLLFLLSIMHWVNVFGTEHQRFVSRLTGLCTLITQGQRTWTALGASIVHPKHSWFYCVFQVPFTVCFQFLPPLLCSLFFLNFTDLIFFIFVEPGEQWSQLSQRLLWVFSLFKAIICF